MNRLEFILHYVRCALLNDKPLYCCICFKEKKERLAPRKLRMPGYMNKIKTNTAPIYLFHFVQQAEFSSHDTTLEHHRYGRVHKKTITQPVRWSAEEGKINKRSDKFPSHFFVSVIAAHLTATGPAASSLPSLYLFSPRQRTQHADWYPRCTCALLTPCSLRRATVSYY